jgi:ABC-type multidrug transport system ATPase subunit
LHDLLTAKEHLEFYGRIRGVPDEKLDGMVNLLIKRLTLDQDDQHLRPAGTYSGGNKRKLSVAIALIGNPPVVFLDEPSTGMDPVSRRFLWNFMTETMTNRAVILTTHSMEECEALCSRIGILVLGKLKCLGSAQHLKTKFGHGLQLDFVLTSSEKVDTLKQFMHAQFSEANEIESFGGAVKFSIGTQANMMLADIFATIEANKAALSIQNYAVSQTSLEQIFIDFAKKGDENVLRAEHILNAGQASNLV